MKYHVRTYGQSHRSSEIVVEVSWLITSSGSASLTTRVSLFLGVLILWVAGNSLSLNIWPEIQSGLREVESTSRFKVPSPLGQG